MSTPVTVRFKPEELDRIKTAAAIQGKSISTFIRDRVLVDVGPGGKGNDWLLDDIMQTVSYNAKNLNAVIALLLYLFGKQLSPVDVKRLARYDLSELYKSLEPDAAKFCQTLIAGNEET